MDDRGGETALDEVENGRWSRTAADHLADARLLAEAGRGPGAVLHAEQAAQCALKALLHGVGAGLTARGHDLVALVGECSERAGLEVSEELAGGLADLAGDYQPVRYPDALPGGTPSMHYGRAQAERAASVAADLLAAVERRWRTLVDEADRVRAASDEAALDDEGPAG